MEEKEVSALFQPHQADKMNKIPSHFLFARIYNESIHENGLSCFTQH